MYSTKISHFLFVATIALVVTACGGSDSQPPLKLAKSVENLQCRPPRFPPSFLDAELAATGANVLSKSCAFDGLGRAAACDTPAPYLRLIEIPSTQAELVRPIGYEALSEFAQIIPINCPSQ